MCALLNRRRSSITGRMDLSVSSLFPILANDSPLHDVCQALERVRTYATFRLPCWMNASRSRLTMSACVAVRPCGRPG